MSKYKSNLFIPGHTLDRLERGLNSNADALIIDLEDGCPADKKILAREELINLLKENAFTKPKKILKGLNFEFIFSSLLFHSSGTKT